jgi:hypothetical protein
MQAYAAAAKPTRAAHSAVITGPARSASPRKRGEGARQIKSCKISAHDPSLALIARAVIELNNSAPSAEDLTVLTVHAYIEVPDAAQGIKFYCEGLGLTVKRRFHGGCDDQTRDDFFGSPVIDRCHSNGRCKS